MSLNHLPYSPSKFQSTGAPEVIHQAPQVPNMTEWSPASTAPTALPTPLSSSRLAPRYPWNQDNEIAQLRGQLAMEREKNIRAETEIQKLQASKRLSADMVMKHHICSQELEREKGERGMDQDVANFEKGAGATMGRDLKFEKVVLFRMKKEKSFE
ncbi:unnamed protein product [Caenorhabditis nigoni]